MRRSRKRGSSRGSDYAVMGVIVTARVRLRAAGGCEALPAIGPRSGNLAGQEANFMRKIGT